MTEKRYDAPLLTKRLYARRGLKAERPAPVAHINLKTFRLPDGSEAYLERVEGDENVFQLRTWLQLDQDGARPPYERVEVETLDEALAEKIAHLDIKPEGLRPEYLPVTFRPQRVELTLGEIAKPPVDFDYKRDGELVDRPTTVFAPDQRYIYQDTAFPWRIVGRVDTPLGWCTGCLIGPRLLLTANHCIQWNGDGTAGWVRFRPAFYNGSAPFGEAWATRIIHWTRTTPADGLTDNETAFDYVVCVLDTRMGDSLGYAGYRTYDDDWNGGSYWQHMGYPSDLTGGQRPAFQGSCVVSSVGNQSAAGQTGYVLGHFNDIVGGHSGGPVWGWWGDEPWPRVVGVQSTEAFSPGMSTSGDNEYGGGPALSSLISWARSNYA